MIARKTKPTSTYQPVYLDDIEIIDGTMPPDAEQPKHKQQHTMAKAQAWLQMLMMKQDKNS